MLSVPNKLLLALIQAATEFLPISSSGHLALFSGNIRQPDLFFFSALHLSSLAAVMIFTRKELASLLSFRKEYRVLWIYLAAATVPAALCGFFFKGLIEKVFSSYLCIGLSFIFTGVILFLSRCAKKHSELNLKNSVIIGLFQAIALLPGASRSGMTISSALFLGVKKEKAAKFSFMLFIPLSLGAFILNIQGGNINAGVIVSFIVCLALSVLFLRLLLAIVKKGAFWMFSFYCFAMGMFSIYRYLTS